MNEKKPTTKTFSRRGFLGASLATAAAVGLPGSMLRQDKASSEGKLPLKIREYRALGRTGVKVSDVSFGAGNLSNAGVLRAALDRGINYIDTGEHYENGGSERTIGEVLKSCDRKSLFISTKLNLTFDKRNTKESIKERFAKCLERMQTDYADCLMIHMCTLAQVKYEPYHEAIRELKAEGRVRFSGLSNHGADLSLYGRLDDPMDQVVLAAAEDGRFDVVLFVYNYLKTEQGEKILAACKGKNMGTTLMKMDPAFYIGEDKKILSQIHERYEKAGKELPEVVKNIERLAVARAEKTEAFLAKHNLEGPEQSRAAAIKFCLNHPEVDCVCPTINTFDDLDAFVAMSGQKLKLADAALLEDLASAAGDFYCRHACGRCEPACPRNVPVNTIMRYDYYYRAKRQEKMAMGRYRELDGLDASDCADCAGACQAACPYGVPIQGKLIMAHQALSLP